MMIYVKRQTEIRKRTRQIGNTYRYVKNNLFVQLKKLLTIKSLSGNLNQHISVEMKFSDLSCMSDNNLCIFFYCGW